MSDIELHEPDHFYNFIPKAEGVLARLEKQAVEEDVPIVGPVMARILYILAKTTGAKRILELGTATGYSAIFLGKAAQENGGKVVTMEWDPETAAVAAKNIEEAGYTDVVQVAVGDARENMKTYSPGSFDMIFNDVEKEYYTELLKPTLELLRPGGLMLLDNTAFKTAGDFLEVSFEHPQLETVHLYGLFPNHDPDYDALTICMKK